MNKPVIHFASRHEDGNIFFVLAKVRAVFQHEHRIADYNNIYESVTNSHSYEEALAVIRQYINLIDDDGEY